MPPWKVKERGFCVSDGSRTRAVMDFGIWEGDGCERTYLEIVPAQIDQHEIFADDFTC